MRRPTAKQRRLTLQQDLDHAVRHHNAGRLAEAERLYRRILQTDAKQPAVLHLLGIAAQQGGDYQKAVKYFTKALVLKPEYAEAHNNLGNALKQLGKLDEAVLSYRQALALLPDLAEAHNNLGNALKDLGQLEAAVASYHKALALKPDTAEAHNNLGNALQDLGKPEAAVASYHQALALKPDYAEAHVNLGKARHELGKLDAAIASYRQALTLKPDLAEAHYNYANALRELGKLEDAVAGYRQALVLKPDYAEAHNNLGNALKDLGRAEEAFTHQRRALALDPGNGLFWAALVAALETLSFSAVDEDLWQLLEDLLAQPTVRPSRATRPLISALRRHPDFPKILHAATAVGAAGTAGRDMDISFADAAARLSSIPIFLRIIGLSPIDDLEIERMLTALRRAMLSETQSDAADETGLHFAAALALQCFANEYVYAESDAEIAVVAQLQHRIAALLEEGRDVPPSFIAALGAYRPLHDIPGARELAEREWPDAIRQVIERQILEPLEEASLRRDIPRLTGSEDSVSQAVRAQYEENPYPRWITTGLTAKSRTVAADLQAAPLRLDLGDYESPESPEILVAGCGTGQHALVTATRFSNARVLAVDLSLSSLAYAMRKTCALNIANIEYAQADIMAMAPLARRFDIIECVGVLHHLGDPLAGLKILTDLLRPSGLMLIGLYSEAARQAVVEGRALIAEKGYVAAPRDIRRCRRDIIAQAEDGNRQMAELCKTSDFYSLSNCRDLLFHVQEQRFTLPGIETALDALKLKFLGFEMRRPSILRAFKKSHPGRRATASLALWHEFERQHPGTFSGMYQFWCRKN